MRDEIKVIAHIYTDFPEKFGIPRQSGMHEGLKGRIVFKKEYRSEEAFRGLDGYSYIWLLWSFSENHDRPFNATVKPPRLGGNRRMGVFATRSPYHPNGIGLSCVKLDKVAFEEKDGPVLYVSGIDQLNGTPIYDVKPYIPYTDSHEEAHAGFSDEVKGYELDVLFPEKLLSLYPQEKRQAAIFVLKQDPRPSYQNNSDRMYGVSFAGYDIRFKVKDGVLEVLEMEELGALHRIYKATDTVD